MSKFIMKPDFLELFPEVQIAVVLARDIDNTEGNAERVRPDIIELLENANKDARKYLTAEVFNENPVVAEWRAAYRKFKTKKGARCSIEALLKRVDKGNQVSTINPLVDIYNAVSLTYGLPCGGEDLDTFQGDMQLTIADGSELFLALGDEEHENAFPGEVVYKDDEGAVCRCWNWRDGQRTMLTEDTKNAFLIIESVEPKRNADMTAAAEMLADLTQKYLGGATSVHYMDKDHPELEL